MFLDEEQTVRISLREKGFLTPGDQLVDRERSTRPYLALVRHAPGKVPSA